MKLNLLSTNKKGNVIGLWPCSIEENVATKIQKDEANVRTILPNESVLDCDQHGVNKATLSGVITKLIEENIKFMAYKHRDDEDSGHAHLKFNRDITNNERSIIIDHYGCDPAKASKSTFIAKEGKKHFKTGIVKSLVSNYFGVNDIPEWLTEELKKTPKKEPISVKDVSQGSAEGNRNENAFKLATFHRKGGAKLEETMILIQDMNRKNNPPLPERDIEVIVKSAYRGEKPYSTYFKENPKTGECPIKRDLNTLSFKDLGSIEIKEKSYILKPYIPEGSFSFLTGKSGTFKTTIACYIALSVASGKTAFDNMGVTQRPVLFIDEENGIEEIKERIYKMAKWMGIKKLDNIDFCSYVGFQFDNNSWKEVLEEFVKDKPNILIIVDSFRRIISVEEDKATEMNQLFTQGFRQFMNKYPSTWLFLHHHRKGNDKASFSEPLDEIRGSSEIVNYADSIFMTKRSRQDNNISLIHAKARRTKPHETVKIGINYEDDIISFENMGVLDEQRDKSDECHKAIMEWVNTNNIKETKTKEVVESMVKVGFRRQMISGVLKEMIDGGSNVTNPRRGVWVFGSVQEGLMEFNRNEQSDKTDKKNETDKERS